MPILMDRTLTEYADQALAAIRLRRNSVHTARALTSAELLFLLETAGDAMRFVDTDGRIAWKATPNLCQYVKDLELDADDDLEDI